MIESKAFKLLKTLSTEEFRWFYKFIKSPYYNSNKHLIKLYELLRKDFPDFKPQKITAAHISSKLFPSESFEPKRIAVLLHRFANLIEAFIVAEEVKRDSFLYKKVLTRTLGKNNSYDFFKKRSSELLEELKDNPIQDQHVLKNKTEIILQYYTHPSTDRQRSGAKDLLEAMEDLDDYFILSKLKIACALKARNILFSEQSEIKYLDIIMSPSNSKNLLSSIYSRIIIFQDMEEATPIFHDIKNTFISNIKQIGQDDKRTILQLLLNYSIRMINKGDVQAPYSSLELYITGLENDCLIINNELSESTFNNIATIGAFCEDFEWTKFFIQEYSQYLEKSIREDVVAMAWAFWHFRQKNFNETLNLLLNFSFTKPLQIITSKAVLIRTYIELYHEKSSYYELAFSQLNTFEKYIRNNKVLSKDGKVGYLNFISFSKKLIRLKSQKRDTKNLREKIVASKTIRLKNWLLEKV